MQTQSLSKEAAKCREQAKEFAGRPEQPFLLSVASAFEDLALRDKRTERRAPRHRV
jgi:hypothetical protein